MAKKSNSFGVGVSDKRLKAYADAFDKYIGMIRKNIGDLSPTSKGEIEQVVSKQVSDALNAALMELQGGIVVEAGKQTAKRWSELSAGQRKAIAEALLRDNPHVVPWVKEHSAALVKEIDESTRAGLRALIDESYEQHLTRDQLSAKLRRRVGLLQRDVIAVERYRAELDQAGDPGADEKTLRYANKLLSARAENIGRTEIVAAENHGTLSAWMTAKDAGFVADNAQKVWIASTLDDQCDICTALDNVGVGLTDSWSAGGKSISSPPAHPQCRCTMGLVTKTDKADTESVMITKRWSGDIKKIDDEQMLVFGWLSVAVDQNGQPVLDSQGDVIPPETLESAVYEYVLESRELGDMHMRAFGVGRLIESIVFTADKQAALGIPAGILPIGWWVGFKVDDPAVWDRIKSGAYSSMSIGGVVVESEIVDGQDDMEAN